MRQSYKNFVFIYALKSMYGNENRLHRRTNRPRLHTSQRNASFACGIFFRLLGRNSKQNYLRALHKRNVRKRFVENPRHKSNHLLAPTATFARGGHRNPTPRRKNHILLAKKQKNRKRTSCRRGFSRFVKISYNVKSIRIANYKQIKNCPVRATKTHKYNIKKRK